MNLASCLPWGKDTFCLHQSISTIWWCRSNFPSTMLNKMGEVSVMTVPSLAISVLETEVTTLVTGMVTSTYYTMRFVSFFLAFSTLHGSWVFLSYVILVTTRCHVTAMRRSNVQWSRSVGSSSAGIDSPGLPASLTSQNPTLLAPFLALKSTLNSNDTEQVRKNSIKLRHNVMMSSSYHSH